MDGVTKLLTSLIELIQIIHDFFHIYIFKKLIERKPSNRLGINGPAEVKNHPWIKNFPWQKLINK
jgi:hypothetical protein